MSRAEREIAALRVELESARDTIDDMARRAVSAPPAGAQSAVPSVG